MRALQESWAVLQVAASSRSPRVNSQEIPMKHWDFTILPTFYLQHCPQRCLGVRAWWGVVRANWSLCPAQLFAAAARGRCWRWFCTTKSRQRDLFAALMNESWSWLPMLGEHQMAMTPPAGPACWNHCPVHQNSKLQACRALGFLPNEIRQWWLQPIS